MNFKQKQYQILASISRRLRGFSQIRVQICVYQLNLREIRV